jgi:hypothetical protein
MPYELIWEPQGVIKLFSGNVSGFELLKALIDVEGDARFDECRYAFNNFLDCTGISISKDILDEMAAIDLAASRSNARIRIAVIATEPKIIAAATHYAESPMNVYATRIFSTQADARAWLNC